MADQKTRDRLYSLLHETASGLASARSPHDFSERLLEHLVSLMQAEAAALIFFDNDQPRLALARNIDDAEAQRLLRSSMDESAIGQAARTGLATSVPLLANDPALGCLAPRLRTGLCLPLRGERETDAVLALLRRGRRFSAAEVEMVTAAGALLEAALRMTRSHQEEAQRTGRLATVAEAARAVGQSLSIREVLARVSTLVRQVVEFDAIYVTTLVGDATQMQLFSLEDVPHHKDGVRLAVAGSGVSRARQTNEPMVTSNLAARREFHTDDTLFGWGYRSVIRIPLLVQGRVIGMVTLAHRRPGHYDAAPLDALVQIAGQVAVAVENVRLDAAATRAREDWQATFDAVDSAIVIADAQCRIMQTNGAFRRAFGEPAPRTLCHRALFGRSGRCELCPGLTGASTRHSDEIAGPGKDQRWRVLVYPILEADGSTRALVHVATDITEERQAQERLLQAEKLRALGQLSSGVAHDINNVLALVLGRVELMLLRGLDPALVASLETIRQVALDAAQTARRLQTFAKTRPEEDMAEVDLRAIVLDVINVTEPRWKDQAEQKGVAYTILTELASLPPIVGNAAELREMLVNIVLNGLDAMPDGGRLTFQGERGDGEVRLHVSDTGHGMGEVVLRRIFEPFFTTKGAAGTGLGLSMAYGIVKRHGGEIEARSAPGHGTMIAIRLPLGLAPRHSETPAVPQGARTHSARVLVVEDEPALGDMLRDMLEMDEHAVAVYRSGEEALAGFEAGDFDIVLTDLGMPGMNGWEVAAAVKARRPQTPVVLVTGWGTEVAAAELDERGVDAVLVKPYVFADLQQVVARLLAGRAAGATPSGE